MNDVFNLIVVEVQHEHAAVYIMSKIRDHFWTAGYLHLHLIMRQDGAHSNQAGVIKLSKFCNTLSALLHLDSKFIYTVKVLFNYAGVFDLGFGSSSSMHV